MSTESPSNNNNNNDKIDNNNNNNLPVVEDLPVLPPASPIDNLTNIQAMAVATAATADVAQETRSLFLGEPVAKDFYGQPFVGKVVSARRVNNIDLYHIEYVDGDNEDYTTQDLNEGMSRYATLMNDQWTLVKQFVNLDDNDLQTLTDVAAITNTEELQQILDDDGSDSKHAIFETLALPFTKKKLLWVLAEYFTVDGLLSNKTKLQDLIQFHPNKLILAKPVRPKKKATPSTATKRKPASQPKKKATPSTATKRKTASQPKKKATPSTATKRKTARSPPASAKKKAKTASGSKKKELYRGPPDDTLEGMDHWPNMESWVKVVYSRSKGNHKDSIWTSPGGHTFRSKKGVTEFLQQLEKSKGDEAAAWASTTSGKA